MKKLNEKMAVELMKVFYPSIRNQISQMHTEHNFGGILQMLVEELKTSIASNHITKVITGINRMDYIYQKGNAYVRYMIERLFIKPFSSLKYSAHPQQWKLICQEMSDSFLFVYQLHTEKTEIHN
ncbi:DUF7674 family protein [Chryseobacterium salviniae]|uniref:DUF7674 domain-containing protein n=1 Tax=Chryseobacterium salviniae TaxID=3101750 RepID=A0ABU6HMP5_9FLAO|nr:hypothetical protein [Chryseobacterium sp. T9W2-O]MEC3874337.1 hypothetical protein [Chryseobacterium sp. T9W2-O]